MDEEPEFLVNDFLLTSQQELVHVFDVVSSPLDTVVSQRALFLKEFVIGMSRAYMRSMQPAPDRALLRAQLEIKKTELLVQLEKLRAAPLSPVEELPPLPRVMPPVISLPELTDLPEP